MQVRIFVFSVPFLLLMIKVRFSMSMVVLYVFVYVKLVNEIKSEAFVLVRFFDWPREYLALFRHIMVGFIIRGSFIMFFRVVSFVLHEVLAIQLMFSVLKSTTMASFVPIVSWMASVSCKITCCGHMFTMMAGYSRLHKMFVLKIMGFWTKFLVIVMRMLLFMREYFPALITIMR